MSRAAVAPITIVALLCASCATDTTGPAPRKAPEGPRFNLSGYSTAFKQGYADACATPRRRSEERLKSDADYRMGWHDGQSVCKK